jgi:hypothetical protein
MRTRSLALQKAVWAALLADAGVRAELGDPARVYDAPPEGAAHPYALLGETRMSRIPGHPSGIEHDLRIRIVSRHQGRLEVKRALDAVAAALHEADLALEDARLVNLRFAFADVFARGDGVFEGLARFRAATEAAS